MPRQTVENMVPNLSQIEEECAAKDVAEIEPKRVAVQEEPVADGRKEQNGPMQVAHPLDEVHQNVCRKEGKQEPHRTVAKGETAYEPSEIAQRGKCFGWSFGKERQPEECDDAADDAPRDVGHKQTPNAVAKVREGLARDALVEIAGLEEEETHEEERPSHRFLPPRRLPQLRLTNDMQHHHTQDAKSTEQVKGIVSLLHLILNS